jgi:hypothetical protein
MAKVFIGIALALMLATGALGFLAKANIDKLKSRKVELEGERQKAEEGEKAARVEAKKNAEERDTATAKAEEATKGLEAKTKEAQDLKAQADEAKLLVDTKTKEVAELTERLAKRGSAPQPGVVTEDPRIAQLTADLQKAQAEAAEAKQVSDSLNNRIKDTETKLSTAEQKEKLRASGMVRAGLQGRILAVNPGWNFVVLSVGDKQGVIVNAPLLVVRNNEPIARLRITSVEPSTSIADVIPGTVRKGVSVQPGDSVIFEGRNTSTQPKAPAEAASGEPTLPN